MTCEYVIYLMLISIYIINWFYHNSNLLYAGIMPDTFGNGYHRQSKLWVLSLLYVSKMNFRSLIQILITGKPGAGCYMGRRTAYLAARLSRDLHHYCCLPVVWKHSPCDGSFKRYWYCVVWGLCCISKMKSIMKWDRMALKFSSALWFFLSV